MACGHNQKQAEQAAKQYAEKKARANDPRTLFFAFFGVFNPNWNLFYLKSSFSLCPFYMISVSTTGNLYESYVIFSCSALPKITQTFEIRSFFTKNGCFSCLAVLIDTNTYASIRFVSICPLTHHITSAGNPAIKNAGENPTLDRKAFSIL